MQRFIRQISINIRFPGVQRSGQIMCTFVDLTRREGRCCKPLTGEAATVGYALKTGPRKRMETNQSRPPVTELFPEEKEPKPRPKLALLSASFQGGVITKQPALTEGGKNEKIPRVADSRKLCFAGAETIEGFWTNACFIRDEPMDGDE